jgi:PAS domain S-box-containing protein
MNASLSSLNKKIKESENKYRMVVENSSDIMFVQKEGKLLFANNKFIKMSGYSMDELKDKSIFDFVSERDKDLVAERSQLRQMGHSVTSDYEVETINRYGKVRFFDLKMDSILNDGEKVLLGVGTDVTSKKKNLEIIRKLSSAIEQSQASVIIFNKEGVIEYANNAFSNNMGYSIKELVGLNVRKLNNGNYLESEFEEFWEKISTGNTWIGEWQSKKKNGKLFWENASVTPIVNSKNEITHYSSVTQDISLRKEMLVKLLENEKQLKELNSTKDRFFSIMAHDLRNPFNAIMGYASLLLSQFDNLSNEECKEYIGNINSAAESTYNLLENILEWSQTQIGNSSFIPISFDISILVDEIILLSKAQADAKNIGLRSKVKSETYVYADKNMIKTVLRNLISNALKFTEKGEVLIESDAVKSKLMVSVIDTGIGISDEIVNRLFKIDEQIHVSGTNNEKGTGLGLILSKEFVNKNGGEIWINRMKNQGTIFNFTLPISK